MKNIILTLLMIFSAGVQAQASTTANIVNKNVVAKYWVGGGMMPPGRSNVSQVIFYRNGQVTVETANSKKAIAALTKESVVALTKIVDAIRDAQLVDPNPGQPRCMDAPSHSYTVVQSNGKEIEIAARRGCHNLSIKDGAYEVDSVLDLLNGFRALRN